LKMAERNLMKIQRALNNLQQMKQTVSAINTQMNIADDPRVLDELEIDNSVLVEYIANDYGQEEEQELTREQALENAKAGVEIKKKELKMAESNLMKIQRALNNLQQKKQAALAINTRKGEQRVLNNLQKMKQAVSAINTQMNIADDPQVLEELKIDQLIVAEYIDNEATTHGDALETENSPVPTAMNQAPPPESLQGTQKY
jgi:hypothetical protein